MLRPLPPFQSIRLQGISYVSNSPLYTHTYTVCPPLERQRLGETNFLDSKYPASLSGMTTTGDVVMASDAFLISEGEIGAPGVRPLPQSTRTYSGLIWGHMSAHAYLGGAVAMLFTSRLHVK